MFTENKMWTEGVGECGLKGNCIKTIQWSHSMVMFPWALTLEHNTHVGWTSLLNLVEPPQLSITTCLNILEDWYKTEKACRQTETLWHPPLFPPHTYWHKREMVLMTSHLPRDFSPIPERFLMSWNIRITI